MIKQIKILDQIYKIKRVSANSEFVGKIDYRTHTIYIIKGHKSPYDTLLHELSHLFFRVYLVEFHGEEALVDSTARFFGKIFNQIAKEGFLR